ncbi:YbaK/EbsC family protein [Halovulum sp. GXIMD14793]
MSKSLARVIADAEARGISIEPVKLETGTLTAAQAAEATGTTVAQIIKSVVLRATDDAEHGLFLTAGHNRVDLKKAGDLFGKTVEMGDATSIREVTGFAIGGVSPFGHKTSLRTFMEPAILTFDEVWAAAGTPHHVFRITPDVLRDALDPVVADFCEG